jgi:hypothetical protein
MAREAENKSDKQKRIEEILDIDYLLKDKKTMFLIAEEFYVSQVYSTGAYGVICKPFIILR